MAAAAIVDAMARSDYGSPEPHARSCRWGPNPRRSRSHAPAAPLPQTLRERGARTLSRPDPLPLALRK